MNPLLTIAQTTAPITPANMGYLPHIMLGLYMLLLVWLCYLGYKKGEATEVDYYLAGRNQGTLVTSLTIMATMFSSAALLGIPGTVYRDGLAFVPFALNLTVGGIGIYLLGSRIHRLGKARGYVTPADLIGDYYQGTAIRLLATFTGAMYVLPYVIMQIKAGGYLAEQLFPDVQPITLMGEQFDMFRIGVWALSLLTTGYVLIGGMRSVAWTDVIQGFLLLTGMLVAGLATVLYFQNHGGFFNAVRQLPPEAQSLPGATGKWTPLMMLSICLFAALGAIIQPGQWMRFYAASSVKTLRQSALTFAIVLPFCFIFGIMLVALGARHEFPPVYKYTEEQTKEMAGWTPEEAAKQKPVLHPHEKFGPSPADTDKAVIVMTQHTVPQVFGKTVGTFVVTLILIAILAASMSTADSNLHALSAILTRDVYDRYIHRSATEKEKTWFGRIIIILATMSSVLFVDLGEKAGEFNPLTLITQLMFLAVAFSSQLLPLAIDCLYLHKGTRAGAMAGLAAGILTVLLFGPFPALILNENHPVLAALLKFTTSASAQIHISAIGIIVNTTVFALVSCVTPKLSPYHLLKFKEVLYGGYKNP